MNEVTKLSFLDAKPSLEHLPPRIILYGQNGIGKSTFASQTPNPVFVELDGNIDTIPTISNKKLGRKIDINSPDGCNQVIDFLRDLYSAEHDFGTVVIDSLSTFEKMATSAVCKENKVDALAKIPYGKGPDQLIPYFERLQTALWKLWEHRKMMILMLAHPKVDTFNRPDGASYSHYKINLNEKCSEIMRNPCSAVLFAHHEVDLWTEESGFKRTTKKASGSERKIKTDGAAAYIAKNTYSLPDTLPFSWEVVNNYINKFFEGK